MEKISIIIPVYNAEKYLRQALVGWRRVSGVTGEYLDHRANWDSGEDGRGKAEIREAPAEAPQNQPAAPEQSAPVEADETETNAKKWFEDAHEKDEERKEKPEI